MQDAYAVEAAKVGTWSEIGYTGPGSNSTGWAQSAIFTYEEVDSPVGWSAHATDSKLNDCDATEHWYLYAEYVTSNESQQGNVGYYATGDSDCTDLTPAFAKLDDGRSSS